jgi:alpha-ketoglutarate-dependent taurine dioxygenase
MKADKLPLASALRRPRLISLDAELVRTGPLAGGGTFPVLVEPAAPGVDLAAWAGSNRGWIAEQLDRVGALLFRGFEIATPDAFERTVVAACGSLLPYHERSSPRRHVQGHVYTSTEHPAHQPIFFHNENSYQHRFPGRLAFGCLEPADRGGETPISHCGRALRRIPAEVRARFLARGWMCVRNYRTGLGLSWQEVFQTASAAEVEAHCRQEGLSCVWRGDRLSTRAVRPAIAAHARTRQLSWFNHAAFFHLSTLEPDVREGLLRQVPEEELPAQTYYGDGRAIEPEALEAIRGAYAAEAVALPWQRGDLLLIDNILVAHGRTPFAGRRTVLVAMANPLARADVELSASEREAAAVP